MLVLGKVCGFYIFLEVKPNHYHSQPGNWMYGIQYNYTVQYIYNSVYIYINSESLTKKHIYDVKGEVRGIWTRATTLAFCVVLQDD